MTPNPQELLQVGEEEASIKVHQCAKRREGVFTQFLWCRDQDFDPEIHGIVANGGARVKITIFVVARYKKKNFINFKIIKNL